MAHDPLPPDRASAPVAVLWDLDGVLVDTEALLFEAERIAFAEHGVTLTAERKKPYIGLGGREVMALMAAEFGLPSHVEALTDRKMSAYRELMPSLRGFEPTARMVRAFAAAGVPQAVASGSPREGILGALRTVGLDDVLTTVVSVDEVGAGKPAPDVFLEAARRLGVEPDRCVVVEDALPGVMAAWVAGMRSVAIPTVVDPLDARFERADLLVRGGMAEADADALVSWVLGAGGRATAVC